MSSIRSLREFMSQRLTAAAAEIFSEFEKTIVQYEEEIERQRRLLDATWRPEINTNTTEFPQRVCKEDEVLSDLQLCYQKRNSSLDKTKSETPHFEKEKEELLISHEEEHLVLNQDTETSVLLQKTSRCEEKKEVVPQDFNQYEEETCQRHINWNPQIRLRKIDPPQQRVCKQEEVLSDQQLWNQQRNSSLDQEEPELLQMKEEPELLQMKEEHEELCSSQEGEQLVLKQETDTFMLIPTYQEGDLREAEANTEQLCCRNTTDSNHVDHCDVSTSQLDSGSGEKPFKCDVCGKTFTQIRDIHSHYRTHTHKPYKCEICRKAFLLKSIFVNHKRIHTDKKTLKCKTCGRLFLNKGGLTKHRRIHTGKKLFHCDTCGKIFLLKRSFMKHQKSHTVEKPFQCDTCGKAFRERHSLLSHKRSHTGEKPFQCDTCGKCYSHRKSFLIHKTIHTGENPLKCEICGRVFKLKSSFMKHITIHAGEKPYKCDTCGKCFVLKNGLTRHIRLQVCAKQ